MTFSKVNVILQLKKFRKDRYLRDINMTFDILLPTFNLKMLI